MPGLKREQGNKRNEEYRGEEATQLTKLDFSHRSVAREPSKLKFIWAPEVPLGTCEWHDNVDPTWCSSVMDNAVHILDNHILNQLLYVPLGTCEWHDNVDPTWCSSVMDNAVHILDNHILNQLLYVLLGTCEWHDNVDPAWCSSLMDIALYILDNHILIQ
ncbi:hypothetical protein Cgig2_013735 [Carnegiea gigantea]|uniref:Uncharacterized protein n=1 Tax=Carnegiea gigantea TaxID=171969 RepID=A0A9Q1Q7W4_9CARY|nr:hypothetical protein Cgig2_013735 [Carnegiea gigantea]